MNKHLCSFAGLILAVSWVVPSRAEMVNRWSFNVSGSVPAGTEFIDSVSGSVAVVRGVNATATGYSLVLPGTTTGNQPAASIAAYVDLPNGLLSSKTNLTIEIWATALSSKNWQRLFDFGSTVQAGDGLGAVGEWTGTGAAPGSTAASDSVMLALQRGGNISTQRLEANQDTMFSRLDSALETTAGVEHHYVVTFSAGQGIFPTGGRFTWFRDSVQVGILDVPYSLSQLQDVNNWLGRSQFSADSNSNAAYNEVRIYNRALGAAEVQASYEAGPELGLRQRWSFNDTAGNISNGAVLSDLIKGAPAVLRGVGATYTGTALSLPGTTTGNQAPSVVSAYLDLPNGLISGLHNVSVELWATPGSSQNFQRLFDFGNANGAGDGLGATGEWTGLATTAPGATTASDEFGLTLNVGASINSQRLYGRLNYQQSDGLNLYVDSNLATTIGQQYHYVVTFEEGIGAHADTGGRESWYRDGVLIATLDLPYRLSAVNDVNNWIARSQFSQDPIAKLTLDELRIYAYALQPEHVLASRDAGPDAVFVLPAPVAVADAVTMHPGQKALIDVVANDDGYFLAASVAITSSPTAGSVSVHSDGKVLYTNTDSTAPTDSFAYTVQGPGGTSAPVQVEIQFTDQLRINNLALAMPTEPPATFMRVIDAFAGLTFNQPICFATVPGDAKRLFICERLAKIQAIPDVTVAQPAKQLFLDLQQVVAGRTPAETIEGGGNSEHGLLGLAFHPNYTANGYFYVAYTVRISGGSYYQRISRFQVSAGDPNAADLASEFILLQQLDQGSNHDGGDLHFGPDGYLYYAAGDEEAQRDIRQNSQKIDLDFFSGIFRIDVDKNAGNPEPNSHSAIPTDGGIARFSVPADNPFIHTSLGGTWNGQVNGVAVPDLSKVRTEFWAFGLRHPWRMSFDSLTGELWAGDVGQDAYEEVNLITKGGNYGWVYREGAHDTNFTNPVPPTKPAGFTSLNPVYEYPHSSVAGANPLFSGSSIVGGIVYRGSRFPDLFGNYIFCDSVSGHIWKRDPASGTVVRLTGVAGAYGGLVSMGTDPSNQDLLFADYLNGRVLRLATGTDETSFPGTLSGTGLFADLTDLAPSPGLLPYEPNLRFWSDHAIKQRWFAFPQAGSKMTWSRDGNWTFPSGALWVKHFDLELVRGNPSTVKRLETRVLVKMAESVYGVSYRWNEAQTEATLVADEGEDFDVSVQVNGSPYTQRWSIPSRSSCLTCHSPQAGGILSFNTRQLNHGFDMGIQSGNQLELLHEAGYFQNTPEPANVLPRHVRPEETAFSLEARVRSYLAVNCSYCHRADGTVSGAEWDGRPELPLSQTGLINGMPHNLGGNPNNRLVVPGDVDLSVVLNRIAQLNGFTRMPPLSTSELDQQGIQLVGDWIQLELPNRPAYSAWRQTHFGSLDSPESAPGFDADGDGRSNQDEFVSATDPRDGASFLRPLLSSDGGTVTVTLQVPAHVRAQVEISSDLESWTLWNVPGNEGNEIAAGQLQLIGPAGEGQQYFRALLVEQ